MVTGQVDLWRSTADAFTDRFAAIAETEWTKPTPCAEWAVRNLVDHVVGTQAFFGGLLGLEKRTRVGPRCVTR
ncbi:MAG: hypothetical protein QOD72_797 [Acidimicrobiaceae bacterium]|jgi:uncharacterized protein (TIGR03083 family)|nr:hypothetical protein [Acidimicrobiaceae bacterium]